MDFKEYRDETELIIRQNNVECALYPLIYRVIRSQPCMSRLSVMDTTILQKQKSGANAGAFALRMYEYEKGGKTVNGAADYLIADRKFTYNDNTRDKIYGCIEVKALNMNPLRNIGHNAQFRAELDTFGKLIVTTGLIWRFYDSGRADRYYPVWECVLGKYSFKDDSNSKNKHISCEDTVDWHEEQWAVLQHRLEAIKWEKREE